MNKSYYKIFIEVDEDRVINTIDNLKDSYKFLESLNIGKDEKITMINGYGGNFALLSSKRKGYVVEDISSKSFEKVLSYKDSKYVLSQDEFFAFDVINSYSEAFAQLKLISSNGKLSLYKKINGKPKKSIDVVNEYIKCHGIKEYFKLGNNFEPDPKKDSIGKWKVKVDVLEDSLSYSGSNSLEIPKSIPFPCTYEFPVNKTGVKNPTGVFVSALFYVTEEQRKLCFNTSCHGKDGQYFVETFKISKKLKEGNTNKWIRVSCKMTLPKELRPEDYIRTYIWNPENGEALVDDFSFVFY